MYTYTEQLDALLGLNFTKEEMKVLSETLMEMVDSGFGCIASTLHMHCDEDVGCSEGEWLEARLYGLVSAMSLMTGSLLGWSKHLGKMDKARTTFNALLKTGVDMGFDNPPDEVLAQSKQEVQVWTSEQFN